MSFTPYNASIFDTFPVKIFDQSLPMMENKENFSKFIQLSNQCKYRNVGWAITQEKNTQSDCWQGKFI